MDQIPSNEIDWEPCLVLDEKYRPLPGQRSGKHHRRVQRALNEGYIAGFEAGYAAGLKRAASEDR